MQMSSLLIPEGGYSEGKAQDLKAGAQFFVESWLVISN